ncbi:MAG: LamG-like jellyroll fold domain-containing protein, partial [Blastocatellia bacterium]
MGAGDQSISIFGNGIGDRTGASVAVGDVTGDNNADIIIGAPNANGPSSGPRTACGDVFVVPGSVNLNSTVRVDLSLAITNPASPSNLVALSVFGQIAGDHLGSTVALGNYDIAGFSDNILDLLIGQPGANQGAGQVSVIFGGANLTTLGATRDIQLDQDDIRVVGKSSAGGGLTTPIKLRENLSASDTRQTPQLTNVTATVNATSYVENTQLTFGTGVLTGVAATGNLGGDLELAPNPGLKFTGGQVTVPNSAALQPGSGSWSVEFWLNSVTAPASGLSPVIGSRVNYSNKNDLGWGLAVDNTSHLHLLMGDGSAGFDLASSTAVTSGPTPQHWAVVFDRNTTSVTFYLNGNLDVTRAIPAGGATAAINQSFPIIMGSDGGTQTLNGVLDDVRVFNIARTGSSIAADFASELTGSVPNLVAYWKFNDTQPTTTVADSAASNTGTRSGNALPTGLTGRFLASGNRVSPPISNFTSIANVTSTTLSWTATTPAGTTVGVDASVDGGATFIKAVNGGPIPGVGTGDALGWAIAGADINGDGAGDLILGAPGVNPVVSGVNRTQAGVVYAVAGTTPEPPPPPPNQNHPPSATVTAPTGGETLLVEHQFNITWTATDPDGDDTIKNFEVDLSIDSGATFSVIVGVLDGKTRSYMWTVPA